MTPRDPIFADLNPHQREAVKVLSGPLLILAGAGSGKTKTLTHRIANLIANGVKASEILAVTFTNKAANEMKGRVEKLLSNLGTPELRNLPTLGTFHAICVRILREDIENLVQTQHAASLARNFVIFDTDDSRGLMKIILKELGYDEKEIKHRAILSHISSAKNQLQTPADYTCSVDSNRFTEAVMKAFPEYQKKLKEHNALDFDDLLQKTVQLFEACPDVLEKYRKRWQHLLVDEYQDTNFAQYRFVRLLSDVHQNLCVIGDDHQSIYAFRGADYSNILNFEKDFPNTVVIKLEQNYRSTGHILTNANALISHNETGRKKNLWTKNDSGDPIEIHEVFNERDEGELIAKNIQTLVESDTAKFSDCAVLYRMNAQSRSLEEALMRAQIPYQIVGGTRFFDRREIKDLVSYLRLIFNPRDDLAFLRIINVPTRQIGTTTIETLRNFAKNYTMSLFEVLQNIKDIEGISDTKKSVLHNFREIMLQLQKISRKEPISILLDRLIEKTNFLAFLDDGTAEGESRQQNVQELFSVANRYDAAENPLAAFLEGVALISDIDNFDDASDTVTLMTMHASKGLEFPIVFLPGWEDGIFPSSNAQFSSDNLEEERRLGYVAITRAKKKCFISHARQRMLFGQTNYAAPSKFLSELDDECTERFSTVGDSTPATRKNSWFPTRIKFSDKILPLVKGGMRGGFPTSSSKISREAIFGTVENTTGFVVGSQIRHKEFGEGTVIQTSGDVLSVAFTGRGVKKIVASVAPIEKIEG